MFDVLKVKALRVLIKYLVPYNWRGKGETRLAVKNLSVGLGGHPIRLRVYTPQDAGAELLPVVLFFHGGGWAAGDLDSHDFFCRDVCVQARHIVVAVDYRLRPEARFPDAANDCIAALGWLRDHAAQLGADADKVTLCGDSAGGNLAAIVAQQARTLHPGLVKGQLLIYPATDHHTGDWGSYETYGVGHALPRKSLVMLWDLYLRGGAGLEPGQVRHPLCTPMLEQNLAGLPPALVQLAECDVLQDEGRAYSQRMSAAGVDSSFKIYKDQEHGFVGLAPSRAHKQVVADIAQWLAQRGI